MSSSLSLQGLITTLKAQLPKGSPRPKTLDELLAGSAAEFIVNIGRVTGLEVQPGVAKLQLSITVICLAMVPLGGE